MLITGKHGSGKSCIIETLLKDLKYSIRKIDIMKFKSAKFPLMYLREVASNINVINMFHGKSPEKTAIVIEELDIE